MVCCHLSCCGSVALLLCGWGVGVGGWGSGVGMVVCGMCVGEEGVVLTVITTTNNFEMVNWKKCNMVNRNAEKICNLCQVRDKKIKRMVKN